MFNLLKVIFNYILSYRLIHCYKYYIYIQNRVETYKQYVIKNIFKCNYFTHKFQS